MNAGYRISTMKRLKGDSNGHTGDKEIRQLPSIACLFFIRCSSFFDIVVDCGTNRVK